MNAQTPTIASDLTWFDHFTAAKAHARQADGWMAGFHIDRILDGATKLGDAAYARAAQEVRDSLDDGWFDTETFEPLADLFAEQERIERCEYEAMRYAGGELPDHIHDAIMEGGVS